MFRKRLAETPSDHWETGPWRILDGQPVSSAGTPFEVQPDGSWLAQGEAANKETIAIRAAAPVEKATALRLEVLADPSLPHGGPGRAGNGNLALGDIRLFRLAGDANPPESRLRFIKAAATHQQNSASLSVAASIDDDPISGWAVDGQIGKSQAAVFFLEPDQEIHAGDPLRIELAWNHPNGRHVPGRLRFALSAEASPPVEVGDDAIAPEIKSLLRRLAATTDQDQAAWRRGLAWFKTALPAYRKLEQVVQDLERKGPTLQLSKAMICSEGLPHLSHHADGRGFPHFYPTTFLLRRGDPQQKVEEVSAGFVQVLTVDGMSEADWRVEPPESDWRTSLQRARLTQWMTDVEHGAGALVARVMVNRMWQHHFGKGLVATPNDFGRSGEPPTHPELLDYLASQLIEGDWKLKRIHKLIMSSRTYMQNTDYDEARDVAGSGKPPPMAMDSAAVRGRGHSRRDANSRWST